LAADTEARHNRLRRRLAELSRENERLANAVAKGTAPHPWWWDRFTTLNEERKCILTELGRVPAAPGVIALHSAVLARYDEQLNQLQKGLAKGIATGDVESAEAMRDWSKPHGVSRSVQDRQDRSRNRTKLLGEGAFPTESKE